MIKKILIMMILLKTRIYNYVMMMRVVNIMIMMGRVDG